MVPEYYDIPHEERSEDEVAAYRQVPRGEVKAVRVKNGVIESQV